MKRQFAFVDPNFISASPVDHPTDPHPCYAGCSYDAVTVEQLNEDSYKVIDITSILLHQEKYRRILGNAVISDILKDLHPTRSTIQDGMTDSQRLDSVVSRHCQSLSEKQAVLSELAKHSDYVREVMNEEVASAQSRTSAPVASAE